MPDAMGNYVWRMLPADPLHSCVKIFSLSFTLVTVTLGAWHPATANWPINGGTYGCVSGRDPTAILVQSLVPQQALAFSEVQHGF